MSPLVYLAMFCLVLVLVGCAGLVDSLVALVGFSVMIGFCIGVSAAFRCFVSVFYVVGLFLFCRVFVLMYRVFDWVFCVFGGVSVSGV